MTEINTPKTISSSHQIKNEGNNIKKPTQPWKPASHLNVTGKDPNYVYKWVRRDNLDKSLNEGWEVVTSGKVQNSEKTDIDGSKIDSTITKRNLILCRMPIEVKQSRDEYYRRLTDSNVQLEKKILDSSLGGHGYGSINMGRR